jgi:hypothetical protein
MSPKPSIPFKSSSIGAEVSTPLTPTKTTRLIPNLSQTFSSTGLKVLAWLILPSKTSSAIVQATALQSNPKMINFPFSLSRE